MKTHFEEQFSSYAYGVVLTVVTMLLFGAFGLNVFSLAMMILVVALMLNFFAKSKEIGVVFKGREKKQKKKAVSRENFTYRHDF